jgi:alpha-beta hydrolase superfamily lysophospholipase
VANAASVDKEFVLWPNDLHEIFNELDQDAVIARMIDWLNARFPPPASDSGPIRT